MIHRLRTFGYSISQIARELGLDRKTVRTPRGNRVDGARWHRGGEVEQFLRTHPPRLRLAYLPRYRPPLNPQERIRRQVRYEATTNRWFEHLDALWETVHRTTHS